MPPKSLYESDFHAWCYQQAAVLDRLKSDFLDLDTDNLIEEIETLGRSEKSELCNRIGRLIQHLLKFTFQPEKRTESWQNTLLCQSKEISDLILENPSLKSHLLDACRIGYRKGKIWASEDTGISLKKFPEENPFPYPEFLSEDWLPD